MTKTSCLLIAVIGVVVSLPVCWFQEAGIQGAAAEGGPKTIRGGVAGAGYPGAPWKPGDLSDPQAAIFGAAGEGDLESVIKLLKQDPLLARATRFAGDTPLGVAAEQGHKEVCALLIAGGADVNAQSTTAWPPLQRAVLGGHADVISLLLGSGAKLDASALHEAVYLNRSGPPPRFKSERAAVFKEIIELLAARGADPNMPDAEGRTPFTEAILSNEQDVIPILIRYGARDTDALRLYRSAMQNDAAGVAALLKVHPELKSTPLLEGQTALHAAAWWNAVAAATLLLDQHAPVDALDNSGTTPLAAAIATRNGPEMVALLLQHGADIHAQNRSKMTPLDSAALVGSKEVVALLLQKELDPAARARAATQALPEAMENGNGPVVPLMLDAGADPNVRTFKGSTMLESAVYRCQLEAVTALLQHGADVAVRTKTGESLIDTAVQCQNAAPIVELLLKHGAPVDDRNRDGDTPLDVAVHHGDVALGRVLLEHGADAGALDHMWRTPAQIARDRNSQPLSDLIAACHGRDPNALFRALEKGDSAAALALIKADPGLASAQDDHDVSALEFALTSRMEEVATALVNAGADLHGKDGGSRLLLEAICGGETNVVQLLLEKGIPATLIRDEATPLHMAASGGQSSSTWREGEMEQMIKLLIDRGADVNARNRDGDTPLHKAAAWGHPRLAAKLLAAGADVNATNSKGLTPLQMALLNKKDAVADVLRQHGGR